MLASQGGGTAEILHYLRSVSPVSAALSLLRPSLAELGGRPGGVDQATGEPTSGLMPAWKVFFPCAGLVIVACLILLIRILSKPPTNPEASKVAAGASGKKGSALIRRLLFLIDPKKQRKPIGRRN